MAVSDRVETLKAKHADLDLKINEEEGRPSPDEFRISELKREKLRIKDQIADLTHH
jgi:hypothetical protein